MTTAQKPDALPVVAWKCGNEFAPYHPQASHINPDHRDGWNACYRAAQASLLAKEAECEALREQVVWAMDNMGMRDTHAEFVAHVLRRGGTGDYSDCATFIDASRAAACIAVLRGTWGGA